MKTFDRQKWGEYSLILDFETRSEIDIRKTNPYVYATHPSTEVLCMAFKFSQSETVWPSKKKPGRIDHIEMTLNRCHKNSL